MTISTTGGGTTPEEREARIVKAMLAMGATTATAAQIASAVDNITALVGGDETKLPETTKDFLDSARAFYNATELTPSDMASALDAAKAFLIDADIGDFQAVVDAIIGGIPTKHGAVTIIIAGDANALGYGLNSSLSSQYDVTHENVDIYNGSAFVPLSLATNSAFDGSRFGVEMSLAHSLVERYEKVNIIKAAFAGAGLDYRGTGGATSWFPYGGESNKQAFTEIAEAMGKLSDSGPVVVIWLHGETDSRNDFQAFATRYEQNLTDIINQFSTTIPLSQFLIGLVNHNISSVSSGIYTETADVISAQQTVASLLPNVNAIDLSDLSLQSDSIRYNAAGLEAAGLRFAESISAYGVASVASGSPWFSKRLVDARQESTGRSTLLTPVTSSSLSIVNSVSLGKAFQLGGKSSNSTDNIAIAKVDGVGGASVAVDIEYLSTASRGGIIICGSNDGSHIVGYSIAINNSQFVIQEITPTLVRNIAFVSKTIPLNEAFTLSTERRGGIISVFMKRNGIRKEFIYSLPSRDGNGVYMAAGNNDTDETNILMNNFRALLVG